MSQSKTAAVTAVSDDHSNNAPEGDNTVGDLQLADIALAELGEIARILRDVAEAAAACSNLKGAFPSEGHALGLHAIMALYDARARSLHDAVSAVYADDEDRDQDVAA